MLTLGQQQQQQQRTQRVQVRACWPGWLVGGLRAAGKGVTAPSHPLTRPTCFLGSHKKNGVGQQKGCVPHVLGA